MAKSMKMIIQNARCSYVHLTSPRESTYTAPDGTPITKPPIYTVQIILKKTDPQINKIKKIIQTVALEKFGKNGKVKLGALKLPLRDGDEERDEEEYEGCYFFNANSDRKPGIVNKNNELADADDIAELCYSGAYFHVSVDFYSFNRESKGIAVGLNNVMLRKQGDRLDGVSSATKEFKEFAEADWGNDAAWDEDDEDEGWDEGDLNPPESKFKSKFKKINKNDPDFFDENLINTLN